MSSPETILQAIQKGGPLTRLFQQASGQIQAVLKTLLPDDAPSADKLASISQVAHNQLSQGIDESPLVVLRQCGAGCSACCHTVCADITPLEALVVAEYLQENIEPTKLAVLRERLEYNARRRAEMSVEQRRQLRLRCGLLGDDGLCQAYAARPLVCAGVFSLSREACEAAASGDANTSANVPLDRPAKAWTMGVSGGLQRALVDAGLDGNLYELNSIVHCALVTPHAAARWLKREDIFAHCICTDAHSAPRVMPRQLRVDPPQAAAPPPKFARAKRLSSLRKNRGI